MTDPRPDTEWLTEVVEQASRDAGGLSPEHLGRFPDLLREATATGRRATAAELEEVGRLGGRAAERGVPAGQVVNLYLSTALRFWQRRPVGSRETRVEVRDAAEAAFQAVDDAVATLVEAFAEARRRMVRREETQRRDLVDDLLRGDADVGALVERSEPFGIDLARPHRVLLAASETRLPDVDAAITSLERVVLDRLGDRDVLVATREGVLVVVASFTDDMSRDRRQVRASAPELGTVVHKELTRLPRTGPWQVAVGRPYPGAYGIARSFEEAREALSLAGRLHLDRPVLHAEDVLIYRVLVRDQPAIIDLVSTVLGPLAAARGGARPFLDTLEAYFGAGGVTTAAARELHLSVRAVTYRLERVAELTGYDLATAEDRFALHTAVLGAKLLGWPDEPLPPL